MKPSETNVPIQQSLFGNKNEIEEGVSKSAYNVYDTWTLNKEGLWKEDRTINSSSSSSSSNNTNNNKHSLLTIKLINRKVFFLRVDGCSPTEVDGTYLGQTENQMKECSITEGKDRTKLSKHSRHESLQQTTPEGMVEGKHI